MQYGRIGVEKDTGKKAGTRIRRELNRREGRWGVGTERKRKSERARI